MVEAGSSVLRDLPHEKLALVLKAGGHRFEREVAADASALRVEVEAWQSCTLVVEGAAPLAANERRLLILRELDGGPEGTRQKSLAGAGHEELRFELAFPGRYEASVHAYGLPGLPSGEFEVLAGPVPIEVGADAPARAVLRLRGP
jgi:hypothetical protein